MTSRREFLRSASALSLAGVSGMMLNPAAAEPVSPPPSSANDRIYWLNVMERLANPILTNLARGTLRKVMPVEAHDPRDREQYTYLEAFGRLLCGIAPWLEATGQNPVEQEKQKRVVALVRDSLNSATNPDSPDFMNFKHGGQPVVDTAFLAEGILRAPGVLWQRLDSPLQSRIVMALKSSRTIGTPHGSNWVLFAAMIEAALHTMGEKTIKERFEDCVESMLSWYKGDGLYGDGEYFHFDYYNSFVIHPMLLDVLAVLRRKDNKYDPVYEKALRRSQRYAAIQERLIAPDGTFPSIGRSTTYRFGAFHSLAQIAWLKKLPPRVKPSQVRSALTAVIRKMVEAPGTFDNNDWLRIGFYGHQPALAEGYISTGSLYLCAMALLPLGLPPADEFWSAPPVPWTSCQIWSGENLPADHALADS